MKLEENMYVRTKKGNICKLIGYDEKEKAWIYMKEKEWFLLYEVMIVKASHNIIDLIEVGDYVNGFRVVYINHKYEYLVVSDEEYIINKEDIKSIVTKEQFESMSYSLEG